MKLKFRQSLLQQLKSAIKQNPDAIGVELTQAEYIAITDEFLADGNSNAVLINNGDREILIEGHWIKVTVLP